MMDFRCDFGAATGGRVGNRFASLSLWHFLGTTPDERMWHEWAEEQPAGWLREQHPWLEEMQIFTAAGGSAAWHPRAPGDADCCEFNRDLFRNPFDRATLDDYDFAPLVRACRNMLRQGVRPCLKLHGIPLKYSRRPKITWFRVNSRPPDDYSIYANYLSALVQSLVDSFGRKEVGQWRWFVGTEVENRDWWEAEDGTGATTRDELFKLYDWSVFAITRVLKEACGPIGSHAMMAADGANGFWDPADFIAHCRSGRNHATGGTGARLDFFAISCYDRAPGLIQEDEMKWSFPNTGGDLSRLAETAGRTRAALDRNGFSVPIEVSEGGVLFGMDGKWLWHGLCPGGMFDASWTALAFWKMLENGVSRWSRWPLLRTGGLFQGLEAPATHAMRMIARLAEDFRIHVSQPEGDPCVRVIAGLAPGGNQCHVLAFHHAPDATSPTPPASLEVRLERLRLSGKVRIKRTLLSDGHGDFWSQWVTDRTAMGLTDKDFFRSRDQLDVAHALVNPAHRFLWETKAREYASSSARPSEEITEATVLDGALSLTFELSCFSVVLYEIERRLP